MGQPIVHFEIIGKDGDALKRFYGELFGWKIDSSNPMNYGIVAADDAGIGGGVAGGPEGYEGHLTVYVQVDDADAAVEKAQSLGAEVQMAPEDMTGVGIRIAQIKDPNGNVIGILQPLGD